jgi:hypothetical protein
MFVHMRSQGFIVLLFLVPLLLAELSGMSGAPSLLLAQERASHERSAAERRTEGRTSQDRMEDDDPERAARDLLMGAKDALSSGRVGYLRPHLGQKIYLNLFTGINGYYSAEQAFLILESVFSTHKPISFSFSSRNFSIRNPYGFGPITMERRGKRTTAELFLSLAHVNNTWVINQITIATR